MTIARQARKQKKGKKPPKVIDTTGMWMGSSNGGTSKHFNFRKREKDNMKGGLFYDE